MTKHRGERGFTLIELMFVVVIIGILAAIAMPKFADALSKAGHTDAIGITDMIRTDMREFYGYRGRFPENNAELGYPEPDSIYGQYVKQVFIDNGNITVTFNDVRPELAMDTVLFTPQVTMPSGRALISWEIEHIYTSEPTTDWR